MALRVSFFTLLIAFSLLTLFNAAVVSKKFPSPLPSAGISPVSEYIVLDYSGVLCGARRLVSDIAWVQLLQYYGTPERKLDKEKEFELSQDMAKHYFGFSLTKSNDGECAEDGNCGHPKHYHPQYEGGHYDNILPYCNRITKLDPFFSYVYLYGAGALAWNLNRPEEAVELLKTGIANMERYSPEITRDARQPFWQFHLYISAIIYRNMGDMAKMTGLLETAVRQKDCPNMIKVVLANIYQKENKMMPALKIWMEVHDSNDPMYKARSAIKIDELRAILKI